MEPSKTVTMKECNRCKSLNPHTSPPTDEQYQSAAVSVSNLTVLLPKEIAKLGKKEGQTLSRAKYISGYFCSINCFLSELYDLIPWDKQKPIETH